MTIETLLSDALAATPADHAETLFGERPAGSRWGRPFTRADWQALLPRWSEMGRGSLIGCAQPGCRYFKADIGDLFPDAELGAVPYGALNEDEREACIVVQGAHGPELQLGAATVDWPSLTGSAVATCIVGWLDGDLVVYTIHPGRPLAPLTVSPGPYTAVKRGG